MSKYISLAVLFLCVLLPAVSPAATTLNPGDTVFAGIKVHTINLKFDTTQFPNGCFWDSLAYYYAQGNEQEIMATAVIDGMTFDSIGVRFKGNSSYNYPNNKKSFKINLDQYKTSPTLWDNLKAFHLNNCYGDPTFMREKMHFDYCRDAGVAAPRANFVNLSINDTLFAFYSLVEHVDKVFLNTRYSNKKGDLLKAVDGYENADYISDFCWYGEADSCYENLYENKADSVARAWTYLRKVIDTLYYSNTITTSLPSLVNMTSFYKAMATDNLLANLDSYANSGRNFYVYFLPTTKKMEWIEWDGGLSMGDYSGGISVPETLNVAYCISAADRPLLGKMLASDSLKAAYLKVYDSLYTNYFSTTKLSARIDSIASLITSYVDADTRKMYTTAQYTTNLTSDITVSDGTGTRKPGLKSFLAKRATSVTSQLASLITSVNNQVSGTPATFSLAQNYPNPFNPTTTITYQLPSQCHVSLVIYDLIGKKVATLVDEVQPVGSKSVVLNASRLSSGVYFYQLKAGSFISTKKLVLLK